MARFLVIEDDVTIRQLIASTLNSSGHQVLQAGTGREGVMLFENHPIDVVVTDLIMPDDSLQAVLELHQQHPKLPFILVSGLAVNSPQLLDVAQTLGVRKILPKPFKLAELTAAANAVLAELNLPPPAAGA